MVNKNSRKIIFALVLVFAMMLTAYTVCAKGEDGGAAKSGTMKLIVEKPAEVKSGPTFANVTLKLLNGFAKTAELFGLTLLFAIPLGLIFSFISMSKITPLRWIMRFIIWVIRGTPLMLQLIIIYYGPGLIVKAAERSGTSNVFVDFFTKLNGMDALAFATIAFVLNYACYFSEIFRGGIESIPVGQREAGQVLGMTKWQIFFRITLIQVVKRIVPPMSNEIITLVKDTSLARIITVYEIIWAGQKFIKLNGIIWPLFYTGAFYLLFCGMLTVLFRFIEKKLDYIKC